MTNTGNVTLTSTQVTDSDFNLGTCVEPASLAPGASFTCLLTTTAVRGQHADTGSVSAEDPNDVVVRDSDDAHYFGLDRNQPSISIRSLTGTLSGQRKVMSGTFTITDESQSGSSPDGFLIALTKYQVDWEFSARGSFEQSFVNGSSGGWLKVNGQTVNYTCTYSIVSIDGSTAQAGPLAGQPVIFDETTTLGYTCTFDKAFPTRGTLRGTVRAEIFNRAMEFLYRQSFSL